MKSWRLAFAVSVLTSGLVLCASIALICVVTQEATEIPRLPAIDPDPRPDPLPAHLQPPIIEQGVEVSAAELKQLSEQPK